MESDTKALLIAAFLVAITSVLIFLLCIYLGFKETKKNGILKESSSVKEALNALLFGGYSVASEGHAWVRWTLPLWIAICMAIFVKGQLLYSWGIQYWIGSGDLKYGDNLSYNIDTSVSALWDENAELFAVVLAAFSLIWPHVKLFYALILYYLPLQIGDKS
ncbi:hypothetical protein CYMTET_28626 [Cymbomonas tetramitiformis]|uniref:Uncharacterized protein n=1 Tax=Cymbomonas tetramitiformis TaxID=36881 RepID=A0AAE0FMS0_9CHLO|nr:hypothetical protein CYMTET_28626 [Cymbomonas tetramitiformis]